MARLIPRGPQRGPVRRRQIARVVASTPVSVSGARAAAAAKHERRIATVLELDLDKCRLNFGTSNQFGTCTATGTPCYQTFGSCKDKVNYNKGTYTWRFCSRGMPLPPGEPMRPYVEEISIAPSEIDPAKGLAVRSRTAIVMADEPCPDTEADPYIGTRASDAQGTFWTRLLARTKNAAGRFARLRRGFVQQPWSWDTFQTELYIIESIRGPDGRGRFTVELSDTIRRLDRTHVPVVTDGKLAAKLEGPSHQGVAQSGTASTIQLASDASTVDGIYVGQEVFILANTASGQRRVISGYVGSTRTATVSVPWAVNPDSTSVYEVSPLSLTLADGKGVQYPDPASTGTRQDVCIGEEVIRYTSRVGDVLSWPDGSYRAQFGTTREEHSTSSGVQLCRAWIGEAAATVVTDIIREGGLESGYIDLAGLAAEAEQWLNGASITACITAPERSSDLLKDLLQDLNLLAWWDPVAQRVKFKADMPEIASAVSLLTDDNLIERQTQPEVLDAERITRAAIYYDPRSATANLDEAKTFARSALVVDADAESPKEYADVRSSIRYSRWFSASNTTFAGARVARRVGRLRDAPVRVKYRLDPRDELDLGELIDVKSRAVVDIDGAPKTVRMRVTKKRDRLTHLELEARSTNLGARYGFIAPAGFPDYGSASDEQRQYAFISNAQGQLPDGTSAYVIA